MNPFECSQCIFVLSLLSCLLGSLTWENLWAYFPFSMNVSLIQNFFSESKFQTGNGKRPIEMSLNVLLLTSLCTIMSVRRLVGWSVGRSVWHTLLNGRKVTLPCAYRNFRQSGLMREKAVLNRTKTCLNSGLTFPIGIPSTGIYLMQQSWGLSSIW